MLRTIALTLLTLVAAVAPALAADAAYSIKTAPAAPPKDLTADIGKLLGDQSIQLLDAKSELVGEFWLRKETPAMATPAQVKNGLTYRELDETVLVGAVRLTQAITDFRKQKINPGVYTLRLAFQPQDGDHMGVSQYKEFFLLVPAKIDDKPAPLANAKELHELSSKSVSGGSGSHPAVFMLFPNAKPEEAPKLVDKGSGRWTLNFKLPVVAGNEKTALGVSLTVAGHAD